MKTPDDLTEADLEFLTERHLGTLSTLRADGTPHVVAIAFSYEDGVVTILTNDRSVKASNVERSGRASVCQVDGRRWMTLEGPARIVRDPVEITAAEDRHERRFRPVSENPDRVVIRIDVDRVMGRG